MKPYEYSYTKERPLTPAGKPRYRGRCSCGRQTHQIYSTPGIAISAIRFVHNPDNEAEKEQHDRRSAAAIT